MLEKEKARMAAAADKEKKRIEAAAADEMRALHARVAAAEGRCVISHHLPSSPIISLRACI